MTETTNPRVALHCYDDPDDAKMAPTTKGSPMPDQPDDLDDLIAAPFLALGPASPRKIRRTAGETPIPQDQGAEETPAHRDPEADRPADAT